MGYVIPTLRSIIGAFFGTAVSIRTDRVSVSHVWGRPASLVSAVQPRPDHPIPDGFIPPRSLGSAANGRCTRFMLAARAQ
jgi:hypothetical protein